MKILFVLLLLFSSQLLDAQVVVKRKETKPAAPVKPKVIVKTVPQKTVVEPSRNQGVLLLESTLAAVVYVNGEKKATLEANMPKKIYVELGDNLIDVVSLDGQYKERKQITFEDNKQKFEQVDLLSKKQADEDRKLSAKAEAEKQNEEKKKIDDFIRNKNIDWVSIQGGIFTMGSPSDELDRDYSRSYISGIRDSDEDQHPVTISSFKMSKYEVTFTQYDAFCEATGRQKPSDEGWGRGNRPVMNVFWDDANAFAQWVGARLPTEAEWEYACRAGTTTPFNTGYSPNQANFDSINSKTMPVGSYAPNGWGLYDMHGNVGEWCSDWYHNTNFNQYSPSSNPLGPTTGAVRVHRGGSWSDTAKYCRSACRNHGRPTNRDSGLGFRLVAP